MEIHFFLADYCIFGGANRFSTCGNSFPHYFGENHPSKLLIWWIKNVENCFCGAKDGGFRGFQHSKMCVSRETFNKPALQTSAKAVNLPRLCYVSRETLGKAPLRPPSVVVKVSHLCYVSRETMGKTPFAHRLRQSKYLIFAMFHVKQRLKLCKSLVKPRFSKSFT